MWPTVYREYPLQQLLKNKAILCEGYPPSAKCLHDAVMKIMLIVVRMEGSTRIPVTTSD